MIWTLETMKLSRVRRRPLKNKKNINSISFSKVYMLFFLSGLYKIQEQRDEIISRGKHQNRITKIQTRAMSCRSVCPDETYYPSSRSGLIFMKSPFWNNDFNRVGNLVIYRISNVWRISGPTPVFKTIWWRIWHHPPEIFIGWFTLACLNFSTNVV